MTDLRKTIAPKSDQMNSDDLIGGARTITVTKVSLCTEAEQPIAINFEGDNGKPYKPCKSMRRVMVTVWGPDGGAYAGRSMTLYRDPSVQFGGLAVGGIRISHMSHIDKPVTMALTATRANRKAFTVKPLVVAAKSPDRGQWEIAADQAAAGGTAAFMAFWNGPGKPHREVLRPNLATYQGIAKAADEVAAKRRQQEDQAAQSEEDPFGLPPVDGLTMSPAAESEHARLNACTTEAEIDDLWERLPVEICRELGAEAVDVAKANLVHRLAEAEGQKELQ
ncbi:hypothetical protein [Telmatospirillum sp.]|uniref:hypothetical protein n=1 Tax=Telmatospirillum sp. TaxID=2079197 RepID=UPI0028500336|nr:hypothetical protein [Telmatospirillum sp.]MDR3439850.1 hypothetical protein [Telmatospirillum sp.]